MLGNCRTIAVAAAAVAAVLRAPAASACSELAHVVESSYPRSGATNVPTNAVLFLAGELVNQADVRLETVAGQSVPIRLAAAPPTGLDIAPTTALDPHQRYVLRAADASLEYPYASTTIEFTTGDGPAIPHPPLSAPVISNATLLTIPTPCTNQRLCLEPTTSEATFFVSNGPTILQEWAAGELRSVWGGVGPLTDACMNVQLRDSLGNRSPSVALCQGDLREVSFNSVPDEPVTCASYPEPADGVTSDYAQSDATGCAMTLNSMQQPVGTAGFGGREPRTWGMFSALALLLYRRSRIGRVQRAMGRPMRPDGKLNICRRWVHVPRPFSPGREVMESGTAYPYRKLKLTWPWVRSGPSSLTPVVMPIAIAQRAIHAAARLRGDPDEGPTRERGFVPPR
jgi:hypothetical protein